MKNYKKLISVIPLVLLVAYTGFLLMHPKEKTVQDSFEIKKLNSFKDIEAFMDTARIKNDGSEEKARAKVADIMLASNMILTDSNLLSEAEMQDRGKITREVKDYSHKISAENVNLRDNPDTSSKIITKLAINEKINIVDSSGGWSRVKTSKGTIGWVKNDFVVKKDAVVAAKSKPNAVAGAEKKKPVPVGQQAVSAAKKYLGVKYVWGGASPKGFDCSGLVKYIYSKYGVTLNRVAADQAKQGTKVTRDKLKAGDLVFFDTDGGKNYINHVGMYIGNGQFIHASSGRSAHKVIVSSLNDKFYSKAYITARRIFK